MLQVGQFYLGAKTLDKHMLASPSASLKIRAIALDNKALYEQNLYNHVKIWETTKLLYFMFRQRYFGPFLVNLFTLKRLFGSTKIYY